MLDRERIPRHVAIIMDGNGRWAKKRFLPAFAGHNAGMKAMIEIVRHASDIGIGYLTVYAFSTENWKRSREEVGGIFKLLVRYVDSQLKELHANNVKVNILGDVSVFPDEAIERLDRMVTTTKDNTGMVFNIALNYGGRDDIRRACVSVAEEVKAGRLEPEDITEEEIGKRLWTGIKDVPDPELLIRTSGEERISNYLLWQIAYSEFVFADALWPDFTPEEMDKAIEKYQKRDRRFGGR
ncbi:MAG: isoprenyl transferase [Bacillota bacterium]|nr:isoprenyl transferase [Bacillota bacterium]